MNNKQLLDLMETLIAWLAGIPALPILMLFSLVGLSIGFFFVIKPSLAIEIQRRFYAKINWKIEPISMQKEIRNTRIMGWLLIAILIATLVLILTKKSILI